MPWSAFHGVRKGSYEQQEKREKDHRAIMICAEKEGRKEGMRQAMEMLKGGFYQKKRKQCSDIDID